MIKKDTDLDLTKLRKKFLDVNKLELSSHNISKFPWKIYHIHEDGWENSQYRIYIHSRTSENVRNPVIQDLLDFLKVNVIPEDINNEIENITFYISLIDLLFDQLNKREIERAVEGEYTNQPYDLNEKQLWDIVESQVELCVHKKLGINKIKLVSTLCPIEMHEVDELILLQSKNIKAKIKKWNKTERCVFASQYGHHVWWDNDNWKSPLEQESFVEIEYEFQGKFNGFRDKKLQECLFRTLDLIKWTIMVLSKNPYPLREGTCIITKNGGNTLDTYRRDENICFLSKGNNANFVVKAGMEKKARELINDYYNTSKEFADLKDALWDALWFFGRACVSPFERDSLIDSVIGLEKLLIVGHEQLGYKFRLHGATIFSTRWNERKVKMFKNEKGLFESRDMLVTWFNRLYTQRSGAVHGGNEVENEYAKSAIYALAVIIDGIIYLQKENLLNLKRFDKEKRKNMSIANLVEQYVINKTVLNHID